MSSDPIGDDVRKQRRQRRLGHEAACAICGETNPEMLKRVPRALLERHHVAGRVNDSGLTAVVCLNHHAVLSEGQRHHGIDLRQIADRTPARRTVGLLHGLADFAEQLVPSLRRHADQLENYDNDKEE